MLILDCKTLQTHPSLLLLRMALIDAEKETPPSPIHIDTNEQMALQLIEQMRADYRKPFLFSNWKDEDLNLDAFRFQEVIGSNA